MKQLSGTYLEKEGDNRWVGMNLIYFRELFLLLAGHNIIVLICFCAAAETSSHL